MQETRDRDITYVGARWHASYWTAEFTLFGKGMVRTVMDPKTRQPMMFTCDKAAQLMAWHTREKILQHHYRAIIHENTALKAQAEALFKDKPNGQSPQAQHGPAGAVDPPAGVDKHLRGNGGKGRNRKAPKGFWT
jgi:hypothetical protein